MSPTIIVAVDASPEALAASRHGALLSSLLQAQLLLLHVQPPAAADLSDVPANRTPDTDADRLTRQRNAEQVIASAREVAEGVGAEAIDSRIVADPSLSGDTAAQVIEVSRSYPDSHVVIGSRRLNEMARILYDSISQNVVHGIPGPITVVYNDPEPPPRIDRILLPIDGSRHSDDAADLAGAMARAGRIPVELLHVLPAAGAGDGSPEPDAALAQARQRLGDTGARIEEHTLHADKPGVAILHYAPAKPDGTVIVMGRRGLSHLREHLVGSVSHHVLTHAHCPVTVVT